MRRGVFVLFAAAVAVFAAAIARADAPDPKALAAELLAAKGELAQHPAEVLKAVYAVAVDSLLPGLGGEDLGQRSKDQSALEKMAHRATAAGQEAHRAALAGVLCERIGEKTAIEARVWLLRVLELVGGDESAGPVAALLEDNEPRIRDGARRALTANTSEAAGAAIRDALAKATDVSWRIALMNSAGQRRDAKAVAVIAPALALTGPSEELRAAAAAALGKIATPEAAKELRQCLSSAAGIQRERQLDALVLCADPLLLCADAVAGADKDRAMAIATYQFLNSAPFDARIRVAALRGLAMTDAAKALPMVTAALGGEDQTMRRLAVTLARELPGEPATTAFASELSKLPADRQPELLDALADRGDRTARPAVLAAAKSEDQTVRMAGLKALGALGTSADVELLACKAAAGGDEGKAAGESLDRLAGAGVDKALLDLLEKAEPKVRTEGVRSLGQRRAVSARSKLMSLATGPEEALRAPAIKAIGQIAEAADTPALVNILTAAKVDAERQAAGDAIVAAVTRLSSDKDARAKDVVSALNSASGEARGALLGVLGRLEGRPAMEALLAAAREEGEVRVQAVRALSGWSDAGPIEPLLEIARSGSAENVQVLALRGAVRLIGEDGQRKDDEKLKLLQSAMASARRPAEKKLVLGGLGKIQTEPSFKIVAPFLDDKDLAAEAAAAAVEIARKMKITPDNVAAVRASMEKAASASANEETKKGAKEVLDKAAKVNPSGDAKK